jgi:crossover junction endodeoxyribonuclease RuvC
VRVLGVDPGTSVVGYGVLEVGAGGRARALSYGVIRAEAPGAAGLPARLLRVHRGLGEVIARHRPDAFAIEEAFVWKNVRSAFALGLGRAVAILAAAEAGLAVHEYAPALVKKAVVGSGAGTKAQVQAMVGSILALPAPPSPADAADALAVAFCHAHRASLEAASGGALPAALAGAGRGRSRGGRGGGARVRRALLRRVEEGR